MIKVKNTHALFLWPFLTIVYIQELIKFYCKDTVFPSKSDQPHLLNFTLKSVAYISQ
ncbi:unnamed protein product [Meloidogyne enterolobii]|uniref:Uncharacterized protein n=1 Tax=Meloidogyne enterolobii TaxID=390850 RepID=A0ACB0YJL1_MELEN